MEDDAANGMDDQQQAQAPEPEPTDWKAKYEAMKSHSREWEKKAKENQGAADELEKLKADNLSEIEKANSRAQKAEDEAKRLKEAQERTSAITKVADANKVPAEFVSMLSGADEDELSDQVRRTLELLPAYPTRADDGGASPQKTNKTNAERFAESFFGA